MRLLPAGEHTRSMILCKVAKGEALKTTDNMDQLQGEAPLGYHSGLCLCLCLCICLCLILSVLQSTAWRLRTARSTSTSL